MREIGARERRDQEAGPGNASSGLTPHEGFAGCATGSEDDGELAGGDSVGEPDVDLVSGQEEFQEVCALR